MLFIALLQILLFNPVNAWEYSPQLKPKFSPEYYVDQSLKYFDTLDSFASRKSSPKYSEKVIRWEWYPWLYLTGYKDHWMKLDRLLVLYPTKVINRDCRFFEKQPFGRCRVTFHYLKTDSFVDIYEEFTFNNQGEITFIEAWSDHLGYLPMTDPDHDPWAQGDEVHRLSTKVPGLGSPTGKIHKKALKYMAKWDPDLKDLRKRLKLPVTYWTKEAVRFLIKGHDLK